MDAQAGLERLGLERHAQVGVAVGRVEVLGELGAEHALERGLGARAAAQVGPQAAHAHAVEGVRVVQARARVELRPAPAPAAPSTPPTSAGWRCARAPPWRRRRACGARAGAGRRTGDRGRAPRRGVEVPLLEGRQPGERGRLATCSRSHASLVMSVGRTQPVESGLPARSADDSAVSRDKPTLSAPPLMRFAHFAFDPRDATCSARARCARSTGPATRSSAAPWR